MKLNLWKKTLIALFAGILVGVILTYIQIPYAKTSLKTVADFFFNMIKMLIVPLVFISLVAGMINMGEQSKMGRISAKVFTFYLGTTAIAVIIGLAFAMTTHLGQGVNSAGAYIPQQLKDAAAHKITLRDTILGLIPTNIIKSMAKNDLLPIIVFSLLLGHAINKAGENASLIRNFFTSASHVIYQFTGTVMKFVPIGVFAIMAWAVISFGVQIVGYLLLVILVCYAACIFHTFITYSVILKSYGLNPFTFFKKVIDPALFAFASASSSGTLPISTTTTQEKMGVPNGIASFVLPIGATINMDGTAIYQGVCAIFIANAFGIDLTSGQYLMIVLMATLASIGTAGAPGAGLIMLSGLLVAVGLPLEGVGLIYAIDRLLDMARTCVNVVGDNMVAVAIAKSEKQLDISVYQQSNV